MHQQHIKGKRWIFYQNSIYKCSSNIWWIYASFQKYFQRYDLSRRHWSSRCPSMNGLKFNPSTMNTEHGRGEGLTCLGARCKPGLNWPLYNLSGSFHTEGRPCHAWPTSHCGNFFVQSFYVQPSVSSLSQWHLPRYGANIPSVTLNSTFSAISTTGHPKSHVY